jgi:hypothetical protein
VVEAIVPARKRELRWCPYVVMQLQKSISSILASNKLTRSAPKRVAVRVNGGLAGANVGGETSAFASCETMLVIRAAPE